MVSIGIDVRRCNLCDGVLSDDGCSNHACVMARDSSLVMRGLHELAISKAAGQEMGCFRRKRTKTTA